MREVERTEVDGVTVVSAPGSTTTQILKDELKQKAREVFGDKDCWARNDAPTHYCKICGAKWWLGEMTHGSMAWSLRSPCCDNVAMGEQIQRLPPVLQHQTFESEVTRLLGNALNYSEMTLRRLKAGGYVAGLESNAGKYTHGTGDTLLEAVERLAAKLRGQI